MAKIILSKLQEELNESNIFVKILKQHLDSVDMYLDNNKHLIFRAGVPLPGEGDARCYSQPTTNEIAGIIVGEEKECKRDILLKWKDGIFFLFF